MINNDLGLREQDSCSKKGGYGSEAPTPKKRGVWEEEGGVCKSE